VEKSARHRLLVIESKKLRQAGVDIERCLQSAEDCIWLFGVERFDPDAERLVRKVRASNRTIRVVVLVASQQPADIVRALNAGVSGFLCQDIQGDQLLKSLELIVLGQTVIYPHFWKTACSETTCQGGANVGLRVDAGAANDASSLPARLESAGETFSGSAGEESASESSASHVARGLSRRELLILRNLARLG
jgi:DNA-binding NarL/FixJ family response regulator